MTLTEDIFRKIREDFEPEDYSLVEQALLSVTQDHVMAKSDYNLNNARNAILALSEGSLEQVTHFAECARKDFRDVIYWVWLRDGGEADPNKPYEPPVENGC